MKRLVLLAALAACDGGDYSLEVVAPENLTELVPGDTMELSWVGTGDGVEVTIDAIVVGSSTRIPLGSFGATGAFDWDGTDVDGEPLPPAAYDLEFDLEDILDIYATETRNVMVHGVRFTTPAPGETLEASASTEVAFTVATMRPMELALSLDPDAGVDGDEIGFAGVSVPGEFVPHGHTATFDGTDAGGAPVPAGTYTVLVDAADPDSDLAYRVEGGTLDWAP